MASTKIPVFKQDALIAELCRPIIETYNKAKNEYNLYMSKLYLRVMPAELLDVFYKYPSAFRNSEITYISNIQLSRPNFFDSLSFNIVDENYNDISMPTYREARAELSKIITDEILNDIKKLLLKTEESRQTYNDLRKKLYCFIETNNTPTKLKANMPIAYKVYKEKIEHLSAKPNKAKQSTNCDTAEEVNAKLSKFF